MHRLFLALAAIAVAVTAVKDPSCPKLKRLDCCRIDLDSRCFSKSCYKWINRYCPERAEAILKRVRQSEAEATAAPQFIVTPPPSSSQPEAIPPSFPIDEAGPTFEPTTPATPDISDLGREGPKKELGKCGTAEKNYQPCTTRGIADKLFKLIDLVTKQQCSLKHLSTILFCASQNRDNRKCCASLDLNAPQLQVGSRCLRLCDPSGTAMERVTKDDVTCLYNWNVVMYCHHAGIREM
ncbi:hypothetical protein PRIPAC_72698 [Pristionchus pacificus]|nr:hypothetical protein PRIPAC_72698 [Pristionchus pacificus]|eukprot:PDM64633.1 hypothetical protein PRIPAC_52889 [Pristionchus pacificus]